MKKIACIILFAGVALSGIWIAGSMGRVSSSLEEGAGHIKRGVENLQALDGGRASQNFEQARQAAKGVEENLRGAMVLFSGAPGILKGVSALAGSGITVAGELEYVETHALEAFAAGDMREILARVGAIETALRSVSREAQSVTSKVQNLGKGFPELVTPFIFDIEAVQKLLNRGLEWLGAKEGRRFAVIFQNPGEMRPAGGFLGSFAEVHIEEGLVSSTIRDILEADRQFEKNIVPPRPLQGIMRRWKAADANWFFDFPSSAAHVAEFLESSKLYEGQSFDGIIAVSPRPVEDILKYVGPLEIEGLGTLRADDFLEVLQKDVQEKQAAGKSVSKEGVGLLWEKIFARLRGLKFGEQKNILELVRDWIADKDILVYVKDPVLQAAIEQYGVGGAIFESPPDFEGDYLAIVDANVEGGKTDRFMRTRVVWESRIGNDGMVRNSLRILRAHQGEKSPHDWNRLPNTDFLQIMTPSGARLLEFSGGETIALPGTERYAKGFARDPFLEAIERSMEKIPGFSNVHTHLESGKRVWSTYIKTPLGREKEIAMAYEHRPFLPPRAGTKYAFVFEKQPGTAREYEFTIVAPVGLRFRETKSPIWTFETKAPPGRLVVELTLEADTSFSRP